MDEHDHPAQTTTQFAIEGMRKSAREESTSINMIYEDQLEVLSLEGNSADVLANYQALSPSDRLCTELDMKALPSSPPAEDMLTCYTKTQSGEGFLLVEDGDDDKTLIFATENL